MKRTCVFTIKSGSRLIEEIWCGHKNVKHSIKNIDEIQTEKCE